MPLALRTKNEADIKAGEGLAVILGGQKPSTLEAQPVREVLGLVAQQTWQCPGHKMTLINLSAA